ncbi:hypothetical protein D0A34_05325 [Microcoleus vaginatus PCC 9802]|uniref:hypothetical protein n=1 Tax=Microcoleus vaginatus TaxID=119532 RepID=UPI00020D2465|nr:hypothetical protein MicvaDRAFT_0707 [Microcoleus vaginatus FGP-2]UNU18370.1 hypothetical protein D0A34_05325 [Microcoleus vaginatus PCC 9802]
MIDFNTVTEFSHTYCIAICAFLVPANLLTTLVTVILTALNRPRIQIWASVVVASLWATAMIFHVFCWFAIGVVMPPTYILLVMGITCLTINVWAIAHPASMMQLIRVAVSVVRGSLQRKKDLVILERRM